jgi:hypothetical protein
LCDVSKHIFLLFKADQQSEPRWNYLGYLEQERQWGPALGLVGGKPTIATGTVFQSAVLESAPLYDKLAPMMNVRLKPPLLTKSPLVFFH